MGLLQCKCMSLGLQLVIFASLFAVAACLPRNITISVLDGFSTHDQKDLFCVPTKWHTILTFFAVNYISHAATVKSRPGQRFRHAAYDFILALMFPFSGLSRAFQALCGSAGPSDHALTSAFRAGALWIVEKWQLPEFDPNNIHRLERPLNPQLKENRSSNSASEKLSSTWHRLKSKVGKMLIDPAPKPRHVHGSCELPLGFRIVPLKKDSRIFTQEGGTLDHVELSSYHNIPKAIIAIVQTVTASFALYRAKGNQIELYGYASFGLTLLPYILMSIMNLITAICVPDYPTVFIVSSRASEEAIAKGGSITGTVGRLYEPDSKSNSEPESTPGSEPRSELLAKPLESNDNASTGSIHPEGEGQEPLAKTTADENDHGTRSERQNTFRVSDPLPNDPPSVMVRNHSWSRYTKWSGILIVSIVFGAIPFTVNGSLSHFDSNRSSILQQVLTMSWLVLGIFYGPVIEITTTQRWSMELEKDPAIQESLGFILSSLVIVLFLAAPAIGGFVVVGQMLKDYGSCTRVAGLAS